jgi:polar amino acid transport system substrate-binding protein
VDRTQEESLRLHRGQREETQFWKDLAGGISHEIRNPLTAIRLFAQLLPERHTDPEFREQAAAQMLGSVEKFTRILETIDQFANPPEPRFVAVLLKTLVQRATNRVEEQFAKRRVEIRIDPELTTAQALVDAPSMEEALFQILLNAAEATASVREPGYGLIVRPTLLPGTRPAALITVWDNGPGLTLEQQERVFSPFYSTKVQGMGLGLPFARRAMRAHQGLLELESDPTGTRVHFSVPLAPMNEKYPTTDLTT